MKFTSKLPQAGTTIFSVMSALAADYGAINLGQGFPDYDMDASLIDKVCWAMKEGYNQYAPMQGNTALRETLAKKVARLYQTPLSPGQITITPGGTYALYTSLAVLLQPGDEVILFEPCYDAYAPIIQSLGAIVVSYTLFPPDFCTDWDAVTRKLSPKTKCIIINNPNNPAGYVWKREDLLQLQSLVVENDLFLISDEVYEHLTYDGLQHQSVLGFPELLERSFVCFSFGKLFHCTGWKLGYCISGLRLMGEFNKIHQFNAFSVNSPMQQALHLHLQDPTTYSTLAAFFQQKRDLFIEKMKQSLFTLLPVKGSYFLVATYEKISNLPDDEFCKWLVATHGIATIPLSSFYLATEQPVKAVRFCFAKKEATLLMASEKLSQISSTGV